MGAVLPVDWIANDAMNAETKMEASALLPDAAIHAYLKLIELNLASWQPEVAEWLHSEDAKTQLRELLANVPCSPTVH